MNMSPEDKAKLRAEQSRNSSRLYRLRKKEFQQQLEAHLDQVKCVLRDCDSVLLPFLFLYM
jgi:hypothetical protein